MSRHLLLLAVCASLAHSLPQYQNNGRNQLTPGNVPGLVPGSPAASAWWTAQLAHDAQLAHHTGYRQAATSLVPGTIPGLVPGSPAAAAWWTAQLAHRGKRHVSVEGSPEQVAYRNAELAFVAPDTAFYAPAQKLQLWQHHQNIHQHNNVNYLARQKDLIHQQNALNFIASGAGRRKRHVSIVGSPEWQAWQNAQLAWIAPSEGPLASVGRNFAQEQLNFIAQVPQ